MRDLLWRLIVTTTGSCIRYRVTGLAAEAAFFAILSVPPLVFALAGAIGYVSEQFSPAEIAEVRQAVIDLSSRALTEDAVNRIIVPTINDVLKPGRFDVISLGFILSLWSGSRALNVFVAADGAGDAMWRPEVSGGDLALVRIPMALFGDGGREVPLARYQPLPAIGDVTVQNRFVGDHLLYGGENYGGGRETERVNVVALGTGRLTTVPLPHATSRLDLMGADGIVVGEGTGGLGFSTIALDGTPRRADTFTLAAAREGENRSHAFFFRADLTLLFLALALLVLWKHRGNIGRLLDGVEPRLGAAR